MLLYCNGSERYGFVWQFDASGCVPPKSQSTMYRMSSIQLALNKYVELCSHSNFRWNWIEEVLFWLQDQPPPPVQDQGGFKLLHLWPALPLSEHSGTGMEGTRQVHLRNKGFRMASLKNPISLTLSTPRVVYICKWLCRKCYDIHMADEMKAGLDV